MNACRTNERSLALATYLPAYLPSRRRRRRLARRGSMGRYVIKDLQTQIVHGFGKKVLCDIRKSLDGGGGGGKGGGW